MHWNDTLADPLNRRGRFRPYTGITAGIAPLVLALLAHPFGYAQSTEPLSDVISMYTQGWGELGIDTGAHAEGKSGRPLQIGDTRYPEGIGTHAPSRIVVDLWGEYTQFQADVGVQQHPDHDNGTVVFKAFVDGEKRFDSDVMRQTDPPVAVNIDLSEAQELVLVVEDADDGITSDVANWANATLIRNDSTTASRRYSRIDIAPFGRVVTFDPAVTASNPGRVEEMSVDQVFIEKPLTETPVGSYDVPKYPDGRVCVGLQWWDDRAVSDLGIEFASGTTVPAEDETRVEWWTGVSPWQGQWEVLDGTLERDDNRLWFQIDRAEFANAKTGVPRVRWIFSGANTPLAVASLHAYTRSRAEVAHLRLEYHGERITKPAALSLYNGELNEHGLLDTLDWDTTRPLPLELRYNHTRDGFPRSDRTVLRIHMDDGAFGIGIEDVVKHGCVYVPDFSIYAVLEPDGPSFDAYQKTLANSPSVIQQVRSMPDQQFTQAMDHVHRAVQNNGPTLLSLACNNHKFIVQENGTVTHRFDPEIPLNADRKDIVYQSHSVLTVQSVIGSGHAVNVDRHLEHEWMPIVLTTWQDGDVEYGQRSFVTPYDTGTSSEPPGWLNSKPLFVADYTLTNRATANASASLSLSFSSGEDDGPPLLIRAADRGYTIEHDGALLAFVDTSMSPGLRAATEGGQLTLSADLPPGDRQSCVLYMPAWTCSPEEHGTLEGGSSLVPEVLEYWQNILAPAMAVDIPESLLRNLIYASQIHCLMDARSEAEAARVAAWCGADRYGALESESQAIIHGMSLMGHDEFARRSLDYFIHRYNEDGLLTTGYTLMGVGWHLWTLADYHAIHRNDAWLESVAPKLEQACNWIIGEREKTKRFAPDGSKPVEYGLVTPGVTADWLRFAYVARAQGEYYAGLMGVARAYAEVGYPGGESLIANAEAFREEIRRAYDWTQARSPVVQLRNGTWIPYSPAYFGTFGRVMDLYPNEDGGRSWGKDMSMGAHNLVVLGVLDLNERRKVEWIADYLEDFWCLQSGMNAYPKEENEADWFNLGGFSKVQPYYTRLVELYGMQDDVKPFIRAYFNAIPSLLNTENLNMWEHFGNAGAWNKAHETGWFLAQTRMMLVTEREQELWLAPFVTQHWMKDGMRVAIKNAPTRFGTTGYEIRSHADTGSIDVVIDPPLRSAPTAIVVRLRHPDGQAMKTVEVNGESHQDFDAAREIVRLTPSREPIHVRATY